MKKPLFKILSAISLIVALVVSSLLSACSTPAPDPLAVLAVAVETNNDTNVTVTWATDRAATSQVLYGTTSSYGSAEPSTAPSNTATANLKKEHSVSLTGLTPGTTYFYQVKSVDADDIVATSPNHSFNTTDLTVSAVTSGSVTNRTATVTWTTDDAASSQVEYGTTTSYGSTTTLNATNVTSHSVTLTGLQAETKYFYKVKSATATDSADGTGDITTADKAVFRLGMSTEATTENPFVIGIGGSGASHMTLMYQPLVWVSFDEGILPAIATDWTYDSTTMKWTINLDPDAKFSNGAQITAEDVKWSLETYMKIGSGQLVDVTRILQQNEGATTGVAIEIKANDANAVTLERTDAGSFITDGFTAGELVDIAKTQDDFVAGKDKGSTGDQDGIYLIGAVTASVITLDSTVTLISEDPRSEVELTATGPTDAAIVAVNDTTITMELDTFAASFMRYLGNAVIVPQAAFAGKTNAEILAYANDGTGEPIGSGPFAFREREKGSHTIYDIRYDYWGDTLPSIDVIEKVFFDNDEAMLLGIKLGQIDAISNFNLPTALPQLVAIPEIEIYQIEDNVTMSLYLNHRSEPFNLKEFRQAVSLGIDRDVLINFAADGWAKSPVMLERDRDLPDVQANLSNLEWQGMDAAYMASGSYDHSLRVAAANALLDAIPDMSDAPASGAFVRTYKGDPLAFTYSHATWTEHADVATNVAADLTALGIDVTLNPMDVSALVSMTFRQKSESTLGNWDLYTWGRPFPSEYDYFANQWGYYDTNQYSKRSFVVGWDDAAATSIGQDLNALQELPEGNSTRAGLITSTATAWSAELPLIPLYHSVNPAVRRNDRWDNWKQNNGYISHGAISATMSIQNLTSLTPIYPLSP